MVAHIYENGVSLSFDFVSTKCYFVVLCTFKKYIVHCFAESHKKNVLSFYRFKTADITTFYTRK